MTPLGQILASLRRVCPDLFETGDEESESCEQTPSAFGIVHIGGGHVDGDGNAQRINQQVPLTALDVFMGIKAADPSRLLDGLDALRVHDGGAGMRVPSLPFTFGPVQCSQQERPGPFEAQAPKVIEDGLPWRKIGWQVAPRAAGAQHVEDRVEDGAQRVGWRSATSGCGRQIALETLPLCIRKVAWIRGTHSSSLSHEVSSPLSGK